MSQPCCHWVTGPKFMSGTRTGTMAGTRNMTGPRPQIWQDWVRDQWPGPGLVQDRDLDRVRDRDYNKKRDEDFLYKNKNIPILLIFRIIRIIQWELVKRVLIMSLYTIQSLCTKRNCLYIQQSISSLWHLRIQKMACIVYIYKKLIPPQYTEENNCDFVSFCNFVKKILI